MIKIKFKTRGRLFEAAVFPTAVTMSTVSSCAATTSAAVVPTVDGDGVDSRPPPDVVVAGGKVAVDHARHVSVPQMDPRPRRQEMMNRPSTKELMTHQQRQQHGRPNSASTAADRAGHRTSGRRSPAVYGVGAGNGGGSGSVSGGGGFKNKLRNSFKSTAKRIRQQQTAIDALAKNSQVLGLHNLQESPRTMAQRTNVNCRVGTK